MIKPYMDFRQIELTDILIYLPNLNKLDLETEFSTEKYDIFFSALGFEERCLFIPEKLAEMRKIKCNNAYIFEYSTNTSDNEVNKPRLEKALSTFSDSYESLRCDEEEFTHKLRDILCASPREIPRVVWDISVCSSKLIISVMQIMFKFDIDLKIVYSEAEKYYPSPSDIKRDPKKGLRKDYFGIARGVGKVIESKESPGVNRENLPNLIVAFPTYKPERTKAIITHIDQTILINRPTKRIFWIIGDPNMTENLREKRKKMMTEINEISKDDISYEISTLHYKKTMETLEDIYTKNNLKYHINISALGSKMQSLGIALFSYIRPDVSIFHATPTEYNPNKYSEGCKEIWSISFGNLKIIRSKLNSIGAIDSQEGESYINNILKNF